MSGSTYHTQRNAPIAARPFGETRVMSTPTGAYSHVTQQDQHLDVALSVTPATLFLMAQPQPSPQLDALLTSEAPDTHGPGRSPRRTFRARISDQLHRVRGRSPSPKPHSPPASAGASPNASPSKRLGVRKFIQRSLSPGRDHERGAERAHETPRGAQLSTTQYYVPEQISDWLLYDGSQVRTCETPGAPALAHPGAPTLAALGASRENGQIVHSNMPSHAGRESIVIDGHMPLQRTAHAAHIPDDVAAPTWDAEPQVAPPAEEYGGIQLRDYAPIETHSSARTSTIEQSNVTELQINPEPRADETVIDHDSRSRWEHAVSETDRRWSHEEDHANTDMELAAAQDDAWRAASPDLARPNRASQYSDRPGSRTSNTSASHKQQGIFSAMMRAPEGAGLTELMNRVAPPAGHKLSLIHI